MENTFIETKLFQVKPDRLEEFESLVQGMKTEQQKQPGCLNIRYFKRFYTFDGVESGEPPRELTKIVKCVKYYAWWEFDTIENCGRAEAWFFTKYMKPLSGLLIMPFDINSGYSL